VLQELSIKVEMCEDFSRAAMRLAQERFDVVIIDGPEVVALLRETIVSRRTDGTLAVAVVPSQESIRELFSLGVNFVLYKPVEHDRAVSSLRAARAVMRREKRKNARAAVHAHAKVDYANVEQEKATLIDLGQDGMAVQFGKKLPPVSKVYFQFTLPGQKTNIRLSGQVIWQDWNGRAGVQFVDVPKSSRKLLADYLTANLPSDITEELPDVTVDVEDPMHLTAMSVIEHTHGQQTTEHQVKLEPKPREEKKHEEKQHEKKQREESSRTESAPKSVYSVESDPDPNNRRTQSRYACRLGAEVYRTGTSVPNHVCLTDLSSGGCYLEVSLPFPQGTTVEIVVRTHEMKLRLRGTVQASHPGYGMGIAFELKTKEEQNNVKKLTDFVAATTEPMSN
jgi:hypothetical protein